MSEFYDIVDSEGNVVETADHQKFVAEQDAQKELTEGDFKKLRKMYVTAQHPKVIACQHRLDLNKFPRHANCESCQFAWWNNHGELVQQLDEMYTAEKVDEIIALQGIKFYKSWRKFMSTIASWKKVNEQL